MKFHWTSWDVTKDLSTQVNQAGQLHMWTYLLYARIFPNPLVFSLAGHLCYHRSLLRHDLVRQSRDKRKGMDAHQGFYWPERAVSPKCWACLWLTITLKPVFAALSDGPQSESNLAYDHWSSLDSSIHQPTHQSGCRRHPKGLPTSILLGHSKPEWYDPALVSMGARLLLLFPFLAARVYIIIDRFLGARALSGSARAILKTLSHTKVPSAWSCFLSSFLLSDPEKNHKYTCYMLKLIDCQVSLELSHLPSQMKSTRPLFGHPGHLPQVQLMEWDRKGIWREQGSIRVQLPLARVTGHLCYLREHLG